MNKLNKESKLYYLWFNLPVQIIGFISLFFVDNYFLFFLSFLVGYILIYWLGIQAGFHKLFSHRTWIPKNNFIKYIIGIIGCFGLMGGPIIWSQVHRHHHIHSDTDKDPHSPKYGFLHSYFMWLFKLPDMSILTVKDLLRDNKLKMIDSNSKTIVLFFLVVCYIINFNIFAGLILSCCITFHSEMLVNSVLHYYDGKSWTERNNKLLSWVSGGSTLHKNHHDNPRAQNLKLNKYEFDGSYIFVRMFSK